MCVIEEVKKFASICLNSVTDYFSDRYASIVPIGGISISPTLILLVAFDSLYIAARTLQLCVGSSESSAFMSPKCFRLLVSNTSAT